MVRLAITGACGRMGQRLAALSLEEKKYELAAALEMAGHEKLGTDIGMVVGCGELGVKVSEKPMSDIDVLIDFTVPAATANWAQYCMENNVAYVVGTTGLGDAEVAKLEAAAGSTAVLWAPNMSLGMNLLFKLVGEVAKSLGDEYDIEISETHHRFKRDAPSGTALELAKQIAADKGWAYPDCLDEGRHGKTAIRKEGTIGMHAVRLGDTVGEHTVSFGALGETVEIRHSAHTRDTFVRGALRGGLWLVEQKAGLYSMADVLGLG